MGNVLLADQLTSGGGAIYAHHNTTSPLIFRPSYGSATYYKLTSLLMFKDEEAVDVVQKLLPKKRNLQFTLPPLPTNSPDFRRFSLDPCAESNHLDVPNI